MKVDDLKRLKVDGPNQLNDEGHFWFGVKLPTWVRVISNLGWGNFQMRVRVIPYLGLGSLPN